MNIFAFTIRHILDSFRDTSRIIKHFELIKLNGIFIIFKIFYIRFFYSISFIRNYPKNNLKLEKLKINKYFEQTDTGNNFLIDIDKRGYSDKLKLKKEFQIEFLNEILKSKNLDNKKLKYPTSTLLKKENENLHNYFDRLKNLEVSRITGFIDLNSKTSSKIKDFLISHEIISIVKAYLNTKTISINASFFISNPVRTSNVEKYSNAQYFHWDNDFTKFLKLYVYLTDVDDFSGPHVFIQGTHKSKVYRHKLCRLYSDENIYENYPSEKIIKFIGNQGSAFFVDSYGIHKGEAPKNKSRILLNFHFGAGKIFYRNGDIIVNT